MNPELMKMAMQQMANMSPEQMADMRRMAANYTPAQMAEAQRMMGSLSPSQVAEMQSQAAAAGVGPESSARISQRAQQASLTPAVKAATELKEAGNALHKAAKHHAAMAKYSMALEEIRGDKSAAAASVAKACNLNLAACALKIGQYDACEEHCSNVLHSDANNHKALYRRGQALLEKGDVRRAEADLARAVQLAQPADRDVMQPTLDRARSQLPTSQARLDSSVTVEDVTESGPAQQAATPSDATPPPVRNNAGSGVSGNRDGSMAMPSAEQMQQFSQMMSNPEFAKMTESMLGSMSQQQLDSMAAAAGTPSLSKEQAVASMRKMRDLSPEQLASMARQQFTPGQAPTKDQLAAAAAQLRDNPAMMQQSLDMMRDMSPEQLRLAASQVGVPHLSSEALGAMQSQLSSLSPKDLSRLAAQGAGAHAMQAGSVPAEPIVRETASSSASPNSAVGDASEPGTVTQQPSATPQATQGLPDTPGGMPAGAFSPEMMRMATQMMSSMTPEQMAAMASMAGENGSNGPPGGMGPNGMPQMSPEVMAKMQSPEMVAMAQDMMRNMDPTTLASMMKQSGMDVSPEQAEAMKQQLDKLSARQVQMLMTAISGAQRVAAAARRTRDYLIANPQIAAAVIITLILILLRWLGIL